MVGGFGWAEHVRMCTKAGAWSRQRKWREGLARSSATPGSRRSAHFLAPPAPQRPAAATRARWTRLCQFSRVRMHVSVHQPSACMGLPWHRGATWFGPPSRLPSPLPHPAGPPGPRPDHLLAESISPELPLLVLWGDQDNFTPADGPIGRWFQALPERRPNMAFKFLEGGPGASAPLAAPCPQAERPPACMCRPPTRQVSLKAPSPTLLFSPPSPALGVGHCPHDQTPALVHAELLPFLEKVHAAAA